MQLTTHQGQVTLRNEQGDIVAQKTVGEPAPTYASAWRTALEPSAHFSKDRAYVWYFGYAEGRPQVKLLHGSTLEELGSHTPIRPPFYHEDAPVPLEDWGEDFTLGVTGDPSIALMFANAGDDAMMLHTLVATPDGIENPPGLRLSEQARVIPDARLFDAVMVGRDRIALLGDVNDVYLLSWPEGAVLHTAHPDVPEDAECWSLRALRDKIEVTYIDDERGKQGHVLLDPQTLEPLS